MKQKILLLFSIFFMFGMVDRAIAQGVKVSGLIKSKNTGEVLKGITITIKGSVVATASDGEGKFSIVVPKVGSILVFTSVGTVKYSYLVNNLNNFIPVELESENGKLDEVIVIGYGTKKKKDISTAISSIGAKEITAAPIADAAQALQGRVSGVTITQNSGAPGGTGGTDIKIRGITSLTQGNNPLIVVDGYPLPDQESDNILNSFGTGDIESIDVLKDAGAASIYGVRGSNGVIIITTKRGKAGRSTFNVDVYRGIQKAWQLPTLLNAKQYAILNTEARVASGLAPLNKLTEFNTISNQYGEGTNWLNEIFRNAAIQSVNLSSTGGSEKTQYAIFAGYFKQDGILYKTDVERFNLRFNGDVKVNEHIKLGNSLSINKFIEHGADTYSPFNSNIILALTAPPTVKVRNDDGTYAGGDGQADGFNEPNPIFQLEVPQNKNVKYRATGNVFAEVSFLKYLKFKASFGADYSIFEQTNYSPATPSSGGRPITLSSFGSSKNINPDYLAEYTLNFDKTFREKHRVNALLGYTFQESRYSYLYAGRSGNFVQNVQGLDDQIFTPIDISQISNAAGEGVGRRLASYIGRLNYDYDGRGFLTFSIRRDGSSNFAPKNKFATFPAVSAGWRLTKEPFLNNVTWLNELKVRASFGYVGNQNVPGNVYIQAVNQGFQYTLGNSSGSGGIVNAAGPSRSFNPDIKWEKNEQIDFGVDADMFGNKLSIGLDLYQRRSKDLILNVPPTFISGTYESIPFNTGVLQNKGIDLTLSGKIISSRNINWNANAVVSTYKNNVNSLGKGVSRLDGGFARINGGSLRTEAGSPANFFYGFVTEGLFQSYKEIAEHAVQTAGTDPTTSTAPGDIKFKDLNGDGIINDLDRTNIGNANPTFTYGLTNTVNYKNFELTLFIQGSQGNKVLNFTRWYTEGGVSNGNYSNDVIKRWTGPGTSNEMPRLVLNDPNANNRVSDRFVEDASYLRIKNIRLSYAIPGNWTKYLNIKGTKFYVSAQNLVTVTKYSGLDPEVGGGVDIGFYPQARTYLAGITVDL